MEENTSIKGSIIYEPDRIEYIYDYADSLYSLEDFASDRRALNDAYVNKQFKVNQKTRKTVGKLTTSIPKKSRAINRANKSRVRNTTDRIGANIRLARGDSLSSIQKDQSKKDMKRAIADSPKTKALKQQKKDIKKFNKATKKNFKKFRSSESYYYDDSNFE